MTLFIPHMYTEGQLAHEVLFPQGMGVLRGEHREKSKSVSSLSPGHQGEGHRGLGLGV